MTEGAKFLLKLGGVIITAIGCGVIYSEYTNMKGEAIEAEKTRIKDNRTDAERGCFDLVQSLETSVNDILDSERRINEDIETGIRQEVAEARKACQYIFDREKAAFDRERAAISESYQAALRTKKAVKEREKNKLSSKLKTDNKYLSLKTAKTAYDNVKSDYDDASTIKNKLKQQMDDRRSELEKAIKNERSEYESDAFNKVDTLKAELDNFDRTRMAQLRAERTVDEQNKIHKYDSLRGKLKDRESRMRDIRSKRSDDQKKIFDDYEAQKNKRNEILLAEDRKLNSRVALAKYLREKNVPTTVVLLVGLIPLVPVAYFVCRYLYGLHDFISLMEA